LPSCAARYLLRFHTVRRMSPGTKKYGVSIASQRRFLGYWVRLLKGQDPRQIPGTTQRGRRIVLEYVKVFGPGLNGMGKVLSGGNDKMAIQVRRSLPDTTFCRFAIIWVSTNPYPSRANAGLAIQRLDCSRLAGKGAFPDDWRPRLSPSDPERRLGRSRRDVGPCRGVGRGRYWYPRYA
jgi:hypothetical protein